MSQGQIISYVMVASSHEHCMMQEKHAFLLGCIFFPGNGVALVVGYVLAQNHSTV